MPVSGPSSAPSVVPTRAPLKWHARRTPPRWVHVHGGASCPSCVYVGQVRSTQVHSLIDHLPKGAIGIVDVYLCPKEEPRFFFRWGDHPTQVTGQEMSRDGNHYARGLQWALGWWPQDPTPQRLVVKLPVDLPAMDMDVDHVPSQWHTCLVRGPNDPSWFPDTYVCVRIEHHYKERVPIFFLEKYKDLSPSDRERVFEWSGISDGGQ